MANSEHDSVFRKYPDEHFDTVKYYVMFVGHARSGHSLVGAILDAHPNMVVANELHALPLLKSCGYDKFKIFKLILERSFHQEWNNTGYDYRCPGLFQGKYKKPEIIGDKKGGGSTRYTLKNPEVIDNLKRVFSDSLKIICVIRNPYDTISAKAFRKKRGIDKRFILKFFEQVDGVLLYKDSLPEDQFYVMFHENLIAHKAKEIQGLCSYLGQSVTAEYLRKCSEIIYDSPHKRRHKTKWTAQTIALVESFIHSEPYSVFFDRYDF